MLVLLSVIVVCCRWDVEAVTTPVLHFFAEFVHSKVSGEQTV